MIYFLYRQKNKIFKGNIMEFTNSTTVSKLVLLYVFQKMEMPLTEPTIIDVCCNRNAWISYITCKEVLNDLIEIGFVLEETNPSGEKYYRITKDGIDCVFYFFMKIPISMREEIESFIKENRIIFRRKQEYFRDYFQNKDGSYTVVMKIVDPMGTKLELKLNASNRAAAKKIYERWENKASNVYSSIYDILID